MMGPVERHVSTEVLGWSNHDGSWLNGVQRIKYKVGRTMDINLY